MTSPESDDAPSDLSPLLSEPFARAWATTAAGLPGRLGERLSGRLARSLTASQGMVTVRRRKAVAQTLAEGVQRRWCYRASSHVALRPGEPRDVSIVELQAGGHVTLPPGGPREFLMLGGSADVDGEALWLRDYLRLPDGCAATLRSERGGHVFIREADTDGVATQRTLVRDAEAGWPEFSPGIRRRVLWTGGGQAALLYRTDPGSSVPQHSHGHDEECLMVEGELFLDDVLLQPGDYQLAPAGTGHHVTETDTGVVLYAHGDLDLQFF